MTSRKRTDNRLDFTTEPDPALGEVYTPKALTPKTFNPITHILVYKENNDPNNLVKNPEMNFASIAVYGASGDKLEISSSSIHQVYDPYYASFLIDDDPLTFGHTTKNTTFGYMAFELTTPTEFISKVEIIDRLNYHTRAVGARVMLLSSFAPATSLTQSPSEFRNSLGIERMSEPLTGLFQKRIVHFDIMNNNAFVNIVNSNDVDYFINLPPADSCPIITHVVFIKQHLSPFRSTLDAGQGNTATIHLADMKVYDKDDNIVPIRSAKAIPLYNPNLDGDKLIDGSMASIAHTVDSFNTFTYFVLELDNPVSRISKITAVNRPEAARLRVVGSQVMLLSSYQQPADGLPYIGLPGIWGIEQTSPPITSAGDSFEFTFDCVDSCNDPISTTTINPDPIPDPEPAPEVDTRPDITHVLLYKEVGDSTLNIAEIKLYDDTTKLSVEEAVCFPQYGSFVGSFALDGRVDTFAHTANNEDFSYIALKLTTPVKQISRVEIINRTNSNQYRILDAKVLFLNAYSPASPGQNKYEFLSSQIVLIESDPITVEEDGYYVNFDVDNENAFTTIQNIPRKTYESVSHILFIKESVNANNDIDTSEMFAFDFHALDNRNQKLPIASHGSFKAMTGHESSEGTDCNPLTIMRTESGQNYSYFMLELQTPTPYVKNVVVKTNKYCNVSPPTPVDLYMPLIHSLTKDHSGNGYDFTATNVELKEDTFFGKKVAVFNGTNSVLQKVVSSGGLNSNLNTTNFSFGCWFKSLTNDTVERCLVSVYKESGRQLAIYLKDGKLVVYLRRIAVQTLRMTTNDMFNTDKWFHVAATVGQDAIGTRLYINGVLYTNLTYLEGSNATNTLIDTSSGTITYSIGSRVSTDHFHGRICNAFITSETLTDAQVSLMHEPLNPLVGGRVMLMKSFIGGTDNSLYGEFLYNNVGEILTTTDDLKEDHDINVFNFESSEKYLEFGEGSVFEDISGYDGNPCYDQISSTQEYPSVTPPTDAELQALSTNVEIKYTVPAEGLSPKGLGFCSRGKYIFFVEEITIDGDALVFAVRIDTETGEVLRSRFDDPWVSVNEGHRNFLVGIDRAGYIHVSGAVHNGVSGNELPRHLPNTNMYWRSTEPLGNTFEFIGSVPGLCMPTQQNTYQSWFYDRSGGLYMWGRIRANVPTRWSWFSGVGLYRYHERTRTWQDFGVLPPITDGYTKFLWGCDEPNGQLQFTNPPWYQSGKAKFQFDLNDTMHFAYPTNSDGLNFANIMAYAQSKDYGMTWTHIDGTPINLPMTHNHEEITVGDAEIVGIAPFDPPSVRLHDLPGMILPASGNPILLAQPRDFDLDPASTGLYVWYYDDVAEEWVRTGSGSAFYFVRPQGYPRPDGIALYVSRYRMYLLRNEQDFNNPIRDIFYGDLKNINIDISEWYKPEFTNRIRITANRQSNNDLVILEYTLS